MKVPIWRMDLRVITPEISAAQLRLNSNSFPCDTVLEIKMPFLEILMNTKVVDLFEYYKIDSRKFQFVICKVDLSSSEDRHVN